jgi:hypothetical protein
MSATALTVSDLSTLAEAAQELGLPQIAQQLVDAAYSLANDERPQPFDDVIHMLKLCRHNARLTRRQISILEKFRTH